MLRPVHVAPSLLERFVRNKPTVPTTLTEPKYYGIARKAEIEYGICPSGYFYAGRACPEFGAFALAFEPKSLTVGGSTTPFDTGGLYLSHLNPPKGHNGPLHVKKSREDLREYTSSLERYLTLHFSSELEYLDNGPSTPSEFHVMNSGNWRSWTYELRPSEALPLDKAVAWSATRQEIDQLLLDNYSSCLADDSRLRKILRFVQRGIASEVPTQALNQWVRENL